MKTVRSILDEKGRDIWSVTPDASVYDAIVMMADKGVGALLVMEDAKLVGIVSERDYARKVILQGRSSRETLVRDIMTRPVVCVTPERTVGETMALMTERRFRHLPVAVDEEVQGVISIGDVVRAVIAEQEFQIKQLESYILGG